jgi:hypothetical protein
VLAEEPQVSAPRDGRLIVAPFGQPVSRVVLCLLALDQIDLGRREAGDLDVKQVSIEQRCSNSFLRISGSQPALWAILLSARM